MELQHVVFSIFGRPVTLYALCLAAAAALGLLLMLLGQKKAGLRSETVEIFALMALPLGLVGARVFYCLARLDQFMDIGLVNMLLVWNGGYALWGAVGGVVLAAVLTAVVTRQRIAPILDAAAAPGALTIALCRFAEFFSGEGIGMEVEAPFFQRFPFAVYNADWEVWFWAVFMLEGVVALLITLVLLSKRFTAPGSRAKAFVILYCSAQILLESLRRDNFLRWLFVRVSQLTAVLVLGGLMIAALVLWLRAPRDRRMPASRMILYWAAFLLCVGVCIAMEFAVDKSADMPIWLCYTVMAGCCGVFGAASWQVVFRSIRK